MVLSRGVIEHDASIRPIFVFDWGWRGIFLATQVKFLDCHIGGCDEEEADVLVEFSGRLDTIWPTLWQTKHPVFKCQQSPRCFLPQVRHSLFFCFFLSELGWKLFSVPLLFSWLHGFGLDLEPRAKFAVLLFSFERRISSFSKLFVSSLYVRSFPFSQAS